jgi:hypothetical protein
MFYKQSLKRINPQEQKTINPKFIITDRVVKTSEISGDLFNSWQENFENEYFTSFEDFTHLSSNPENFFTILSVQIKPEKNEILLFTGNFGWC